MNAQPRNCSFCTGTGKVVADHVQTCKWCDGVGVETAQGRIELRVRRAWEHGFFAGVDAVRRQRVDIPSDWPRQAHDAGQEFDQVRQVEVLVEESIIEHIACEERDGGAFFLFSIGGRKQVVVHADTYLAVLQAVRAEQNAGG